MLEVRLPRFNEWLGPEQPGSGFRMGIGLNSGPVMSGNVGSERRVEYTAVGDTTNVAARLEAMTNETGHDLLLSDATRSMLQGPKPDFEDVGEVSVRGRGEPIRVLTLAQGTRASAVLATDRLNERSRPSSRSDGPCRSRDVARAPQAPPPSRRWPGR